MELPLFHQVLTAILTSSVFVFALVMTIVILKNEFCGPNRCDAPDCDPDCAPEDCETDCKSKCKSREEAPKQEKKGYTGTDC